MIANDPLTVPRLLLVDDNETVLSTLTLVVNRKSKIPGPGYETAPSGGFGQWEGQVRKCIAFRGYPDKMPKD